MATNDEPPEERRRTPRVKTEHQIVLKGDTEGSGIGIKARSIDVNLGGVHCTLTRRLDLFTRLKLEFTLPIVEAERGIVNATVRATAVVVRMEPVETAFDCALAFVGLSADDELILARFMLQSIARQPN